MEGMVDFRQVLRFYCGKRVLVTGHTGFKGAWLCRILSNAGADVWGYALTPPTAPSLFEIAAAKVRSQIGDIRDFGRLQDFFQIVRPEIVFHLAAQPLVRESYRSPRETYETNVIGTVNLLECCRQTAGVRSVLNITTDKVYENHEWSWGYRETDPLNGFDPYSNSKSCSELVTKSYKQSFFDEEGIAISTARAGNVIGGGDFAVDRIIPDCVRAMQRGQTLLVRNPASTRPYQHVLEPLFAYLMIAYAQYEDAACAGFYNVGPDDCDCVTTGQLVELFCNYADRPLNWRVQADATAPHEANFLKLDCSLIKRKFGWSPRWHIREAVEAVCRWSAEWLDGGDIAAEMDREIEAYLEPRQTTSPWR